MKDPIKQIKIDSNVMKILNLSDLRHSVFKTNKGDLDVQVSKSGKYEEYRFILDSVPVDDERNKALINLFFDNIK